MGIGLLDSTSAGDDFVVLVRDPADRFHARWLREDDLHRLPEDIRERMIKGTAGVEPLSGAEWVEIAEILEIGDAPAVDVPVATETADSAGESYRPEDETVSTAQPDPFKVDPDVLDRGISGHRRTQNAFAEHLEEAGLQPLSHRPKLDPPFDVAWRERELFCVAEVKSSTPSNQEKQLRLALGQVLRYAHQLGAGETTVVPVIVIENEPADPSWEDLCTSLGVRLAWPGEFERATGAG
jgi:hypothetical protein